MTLDAFLDVPAAVKANDRLAWQAKFADFTLVLDDQAGAAIAITVRNGAVTATRGDIDEAKIRLTAPAESWAAYLSPTPPPGFQNFHSMYTVRRLDILGDHVAMQRHLFLIEGLLASARARPADAGPPPSRPATEPSIDPVVGRYLRLDIEGRPHSVYFEEAGSGIPLLCLHTAGADARQYRALLRDPAITSNFRVIAFDLPWHGKSSPPAGFEKELYRLSTERYLDTVMAVKRALGLDRPAVIGCSIGGRAVLHLALRHGDEFRAGIGLQSALSAEARNEPGAPGIERFYRPDMYGSEVGAAYVSTLMPPAGDGYWETLWHYMQSGPGVFMGDLHYYLTDGDLRNGLVRGIDRHKCPLYLLTGEYDLSATPEMAAELAREVHAEHFEVMKSLGHFPMSENPELFLTYLRPVLDKVRALDVAPASLDPRTGVGKAAAVPGQPNGNDMA